MITVTYDPDGDCLYVKYTDRVIVNSNGDRPHEIHNFDSNGEVIGLQLLEASTWRSFKDAGLPAPLVEAIQNWLAQRG